MRIQRIVLALLLVLAPSFAHAEASEALQGSKIERVAALLKDRPAQAAEHNAIKLEEGTSRFSVLNMLGGLMLCLGVFAVGVHFYTKRCLGNANYPARHMRVIERLSVTPKCTLVYIEVQGQRMLASVGSEHASIQQLDFGFRNYDECLTESREMQA